MYNLVGRGFCVVTGRNEDDLGSESNGAGKSALVMAPLWALTGKSDARVEVKPVLCCAVLCCAVPCCALLCPAVLCCAVLCCAVLCCAVLRFAGTLTWLKSSLAACLCSNQEQQEQNTHS